MPIDVELQYGGMGIVLNCHGVLTGNDLIEIHNRILSEPETVKVCRYCTVDEMDVDSVEVSPQDVQSIAELSKRVAPFAPAGVLVSLAAPKDVGFGLARVWEALSEETGWETMTFRSRAEADSWIWKRMKEKHGINPPTK